MTISLVHCTVVNFISIWDSRINIYSNPGERKSYTHLRELSLTKQACQVMSLVLIRLLLICSLTETLASQLTWTGELASGSINKSVDVSHFISPS